MGFALQKESIDRNHETVVLGMGKTGLSVAKFFDNQSIPFVMADTREHPPHLELFKQEFKNVELFLGPQQIQAIQKAKQIIVSPGIDLNLEVIQQAKNSGVKCIGDIELFATYAQKPIVAITGSNGKSTVTSIVSEMANHAGVKSYAGGNLGSPALDLLNHQDAELFVLELSSFQLESVSSLKPRVSTVLNISPDHLDRHGSVEVYAEIKSRIFNNAEICVVNRHDKSVLQMKTSGKTISFGLNQAENEDFGLVTENKKIYLAKGSNPLLSTSQLNLYGESGILNALAALTIGFALNLPLKDMLVTLTHFKGLPHRLAFVGQANSVSWYNDSKGTNIGATIASIRSLQKNIILLAGGIYKGGDLSLLADVVSGCVKDVILFGEDSNLFEQALQATTTTHVTSSMRDAVSKAKHLARPGDKVLLSPACASFDMYANYMARGDDFEACVRELVL